MKKISKKDVVKIVVASSVEFEGKNPAVSEQLLICAEKINKEDCSFVENYEKAINLSDDVIRTALINDRDFIRESWNLWDAAKGVGKGFWDKMTGNGAPAGGAPAGGAPAGGAPAGGAPGPVGGFWSNSAYQSVVKRMKEEVKASFEKFRKSLNVNYLFADLDKVVASYGKLEDKVPQAYRPEFDNNLKILRDLPKKVRGANEEAKKTMFAFVDEAEQAFGLAGAPAGTPAGAPAGTPAGAPAGTPAGASAGASASTAGGIPFKDPKSGNTLKMHAQNILGGDIGKIVKSMPEFEKLIAEIEAWKKNGSSAGTAAPSAGTAAPSVGGTSTSGSGSVADTQTFTANVNGKFMKVAISAFLRDVMGMDDATSDKIFKPILDGNWKDVDVNLVKRFIDSVKTTQEYRSAISSTSAKSPATPVPPAGGAPSSTSVPAPSTSVPAVNSTSALTKNIPGSNPNEWTSGAGASGAGVKNREFGDGKVIDVEDKLPSGTRPFPGSSTFTPPKTPQQVTPKQLGTGSKFVSKNPKKAEAVQKASQGLKAGNIFTIDYAAFNDVLSEIEAYQKGMRTSASKIREIVKLSQEFDSKGMYREAEEILRGIKI